MDRNLEIKEILLNQRKLIYTEGGRTPDHVAQRGCGLHPWRYSNPAGHRPGQSAVADPAQAMVGIENSRGAGQPQ